MGPEGAMESVVGIVLGVFGIFLILGAILIAAVVWAVKALRNNGAGDTMHGDEARLVQEIYQGLNKLEDRVESLETILFDRKERDHD